MAKIKKIIVAILVVLTCLTFCACQGIQGEQGPQGIQGPQGEQGIQGPQGVPGQTGATGPQGVPGQTGATGPQGPEGQPGADGSVWHTGWAVPLNTLGKNGDMYLDNTSRDYYQKVNGVWNIVGNMQGKEVKQKWDSDGTLKVLAIGNSFSDDALWLLPDILKSLGIYNFRISNLYIGGCVLSTHATNIRENNAVYEFRTNTGNGWSTQTGTALYTGLMADDWDYITMQQGSSHSGVAESYSYLTEIIDYVERYKPNAKLGWQMTWAYQQDSTHGSFPTYNSDQTTMYNAIINTVKSEVATKLDVNFIVPNGTAVQNARTSFLGDTLTRDGFHMSTDVGRYLTALSYAYLTTGYSLDDVAYAPAGVSNDIKTVCIESVKNAIVKPYTVTQSAYTTAPSLQNYTQMAFADYGWTDLAYWNSMDEPYWNEVNTTADNAKQFVCTKKFTKTELPVGAVIEILPGYKYRPEAWVNDAKQSSRPDTTSTRFITVTDEWWGNYTKRAFNVCKTDNSSIVDKTDQVKNAFRIWLPKN